MPGCTIEDIHKQIFNVRVHRFLQCLWGMTRNVVDYVARIAHEVTRGVFFAAHESFLSDVYQCWHWYYQHQMQHINDKIYWTCWERNQLFSILLQQCHSLCLMSYACSRDTLTLASFWCRKFALSKDWAIWYLCHLTHPHKGLMAGVDDSTRAATNNAIILIWWTQYHSIAMTGKCGAMALFSMLVVLVLALEYLFAKGIGFVHLIWGT